MRCLTRDALRRLARSLLIALGITLSAIAQSGAPADLYLEWIVEGRGVSEGPAIEGDGGTTIRVEYRVRNVGGRDAFAVVASAHTALGRVGPPRRFEPGPRAGRGLAGTLTFALAEGMRELCLEVRLQNLEADEPEDPEPSNNRRCRPVRVERPPADARGTGLGAQRKEQDR